MIFALARVGGDLRAFLLFFPTAYFFVTPAPFAATRSVTVTRRTAQLRNTTDPESCGRWETVKRIRCLRWCSAQAIGPGVRGTDCECSLREIDEHLREWREEAPGSRVTLNLNLPRCRNPKGHPGQSASNWSMLATTHGWSKESKN